MKEYHHLVDVGRVSASSAPSRVRNDDYSSPRHQVTLPLYRQNCYHLHHHYQQQQKQKDERLLTARAAIAVKSDDSMNLNIDRCQF